VNSKLRKNLPNWLSVSPTRATENRAKNLLNGITGKAIITRIEYIEQGCIAINMHGFAS
jgi:hypothetical protein